MFHENDSATRILAPILTDLVLLHKTCGIWILSPSGSAWALPSKIVRRGGFLWERVISNVCMFWYMFLWRLSDILNDFKDMGQIPSPWLSYFVSFFLFLVRLLKL